MLNFIFDSKLADILAPVVPTSKLFLAIQHNRNDEVQQLMLNNDLQRNADGGYAAIHVACRHNNRFALEAILAKGIIVFFSCLDILSFYAKCLCFVFVLQECRWSRWTTMATHHCIMLANTVIWIYASI